VAACVLTGTGVAKPQLGPPEIVTVTASAPKTVTSGKAFTVTVAIAVKPEYHIQANPPKKDYIPTVVSVGPVSGFKVGKITYPSAVQAQIAGDTLPVYEGTVQIRAVVTPDGTVKPGKFTLPITVKYQGCNAKTCYPPNKATTQVTGTVAAAAKKKVASLDGALILAQDITRKDGRLPESPEPRRRSSPSGQILVQDTAPAGKPGTTMERNAVSVPGFQGSKITQFIEPGPFLAWLKEGGSQAGQADRVTQWLQDGDAGHFAGALGLIYLLGLALNLTPCVYPLIPITIGYFGRQAASGAKTGGLSVCYALGIALMYSALGIVSALFGKVFGAQLSNPWVLLAFALLMFALGLSMFDRPDGRPIWELQLPSRLTSQAKSRGGYVGALLMGLMVGLVAAPCIGPVVVALIQVVGTTRSVPLGLVTFFTLGVGLATPYLLLGFGLIRALPKAGEWMVAVKHIFGLLLFGMGVYYLRGLMPPGVYRILITLYAIGAGLYLLFLDRSGAASAKFQMFKKALGVAAIALGIWLFVPKGEATSTPTGTPSAIAFETPKDFAALQAKLEQARREKKEVLIDFWATWCAACKELEEKTFRDPEVVKATDRFIALRFQLQLDEENAAHDKPFVDLFKINGLPTVVHLVPTGGGTQTASAE
jgi:thiol:disulfide interchange protein